MCLDMNRIKKISPRGWDKSQIEYVLHSKKPVRHSTFIQRWWNERENGRGLGEGRRGPLGLGKRRESSTVLGRADVTWARAGNLRWSQARVVWCGAGELGGGSWLVGSSRRRMMTDFCGDDEMKYVQVKRERRRDRASFGIGISRVSRLWVSC